MNRYPKIGETVYIMQSKFITGLKHRMTHPVKGKVASRNGEYIYVRPAWCDWEIEAYLCELKGTN